MKTLKIVCIALFAAVNLYWFFIASATPAQAQMACGKRDSVVERLGEKYGEVRRGGGLAGRTLLEVWASSATGTFTILRTYTSGVACVIAAGRQWQDEDWQAVELQKESKT